MQRLQEISEQVVEYLLDTYSAEQFFALAWWSFMVVVMLLTLLWLVLRHAL